MILDYLYIVFVKIRDASRRATSLISVDCIVRSAWERPSLHLQFIGNPNNAIGTFAPTTHIHAGQLRLIWREISYPSNYLQLHERNY